MIYEELWKREGHRDMIVRSDTSNTFLILSILVYDGVKFFL